jgi:Transposase.
MAERSSSPHPTQRRYPPELRERAVRLVREVATEQGERHGAVTRVAKSLGIGSESVRLWVRQAEINDGERTGLTTAERARIKELERDNRELRRANEDEGRHIDEGFDFLGFRIQRRVWRGRIGKRAV